VALGTVWNTDLGRQDHPFNTFNRFLATARLHDRSPGARLMAESMKRVWDRVRIMYEQEKLKQVAARRLGGIARHSDITAWVGYSDTIALACKELLESMDIAIPGDISVMGFDDSQRAWQSGLTSYNFNTAGYVGAIVSFLLRPQSSSRRRASGPGVVELKGFVNDRGSVRALSVVPHRRR